MLYFVPFFQFGTVSLTHFNRWVEKERSNDYDLPYQRSALGFGLGLGYRAYIFDVGFDGRMLYSSSGATDVPLTTGVSFSYRHTLLNFIFSVPVGISYPLSESFRLYAGANLLMGFSNLYVYDSLHYSIFGSNVWSTEDASLSSASTGMGVLLGGDIALSSSLSLFLRVGYEVLAFSGYKGKATYENSDGDTDEKTVYWVFNPNNNNIYLDTSPPGDGEVYAKEDLNGFRFSLGFKVLLGR
ncbi:MAG: hypothetical protein GXO29_01750 [Thermotogae bacterium]|nr:hypothetical protein [Thermotogota bacterium]